MQESKWRKRRPLIFAFLVPVVIMAGYFIAVKVWPFGNNSVMTVDMGQQYIDYYSYYRQTLLGHPGQFFYAFNKDLGGDALGIWAYYLMSPFNLITLVFPKTMLDLAITVMTLLKYGAAGLAMGWYVQKQHARGSWVVGFGTAYALCGWMVANQLNLMWLDAAVFLPLIALGCDRLIKRRRPFMMLGWLFLAMVSNYYMAYMLVLFLIAYFGFRLLEVRLPWRQAWRAVRQFAASGLLAAGLAAWLLLPTAFQLAQSKGTYTETQIQWTHFESSPLKLLGKFFAGAYSFGQMPSGEANVFVGSIGLIGFILYFCTKEIRWQERLAAGLYSGFLLLSITWAPLDLLWHGMQFPVWYPYRFSFVICFWLLMLSLRALLRRPKGITITQLLIALGVMTALTLTVFLRRDHYSYLTTGAIGITAGLSVAALMLLSLHGPKRRAFTIAIGVLMVVDAGSNAVLTLNQLSDISHSDYHTYTEALRAGVNTLQTKIGPNSRIGKTVLRSKNDSMQIGYLGTDQFSSMLEPAEPQFYGELGQSAGDNFVAYTNGTVITDALLNIKGYLSPRLSAPTSVFMPQIAARPDLQRYDQVSRTKVLNAYRNPYALALGFTASQNILKTKLLPQTPTVNQERILGGLTGTSTPDLFNVEPLSAPQVKHGTQSGSVVTKTVLTSNEATTVTYTFTATTTDAYYLQIGANFTDNLTSLTQNGRSVPIYDTFRDRELLNVTPSAPGVKQTLVFTLNKDSADFADIKLFRLDLADTLLRLNTLKANNWRLTARGSRSLAATVTAKAKQVVMTSIPYAAGWHVKVDGQTVKAKKALGFMLAIPVTKGEHQLTMTYTPPYFWAGVGVSVIALLLCGLWWWLLPLGRHAQ